MSSISQNITPLLMPENGNAGHGGIAEKPKRVRPYKPRLASNVKWNLGESMKELDGAEHRIGNVLAWMEETLGYELDDRARAHLGKLATELLALELHVSRARKIVSATATECKPAK
jgi:hypothetical protein